MISVETLSKEGFIGDAKLIASKLNFGQIDFKFQEKPVSFLVFLPDGLKNQREFGGMDRTMLI